MKQKLIFTSILLILFSASIFAQESASNNINGFRKVGWHGSVDVSGGFVNIMATVNGGYQFNEYLYVGIGGGSAYDSSDALYGVIYTDIKANVAKGRYAPFFQARCGVAATAPAEVRTIYTRLAVGLNVCKLIQLSIGIDNYSRGIKPTMSVSFIF